jgi:DNA sulfur modification protein DndB
LSAKDAAALSFDAKAGTITYTEVPKAFFVIDGQHRLYGADLAHSKVTLAVSILTSLDENEEARYFNDINGEQRGVPATLQLEIQKFTEPKGSAEQLRIKIFHELNNRIDSPLAGRLSATKSVPGKLTHVPFKNALQPLLTNNATIQGLNDEKKVQLFINFLSALADILVESTGDSKKLSNAAFFQAVMFAFPGILQQVSMKHQSVKKSAFKDVLAPLARIDWNTHSGTNKKAIHALTQHIGELVATSAKINDDQF